MEGNATTTTTENQNPNVRYYNTEDVKRLKELVGEGVNVLDEIEVLKGGLSDTVKSVAEELDIKASQLNKVIKIAHKRSLLEERDKFDEIEDILETIGRGQ